MERKYLEELGLEKDVIDKIMKENGKDIEKYKTLAETKETELTQTKEQLEEANTQIESFKEMDIEAIKAAAEDYKTKFEAAEAKAKEDIDALKFEHSLESKLLKAGAKSAKAVKALLDIDTLRESKNVDVDIESAIAKNKEEHSYMYDETKEDGEGEGEGAKPSISTKINKNKKTGITKEEFNEMEYQERLELKQKNEDLYNQLKEE